MCRSISKSKFTYLMSNFKEIEMVLTNQKNPKRWGCTQEWTLWCLFFDKTYSKILRGPANSSQKKKRSSWFGWKKLGFSLEFHSRLLVASFWGIEHLPRLKIAKISIFPAFRALLLFRVVLTWPRVHTYSRLTFLRNQWSEFNNFYTIWKLLKK